MMEEYTHFGYETVTTEEKPKKVDQVFTSVASKYDLMNDLMSLGIHRFWKQFTVDISNVQKNYKILDLAGGTGDIAKLLSEKVGPCGQIIIADINQEMLNYGRDHLLDQGYYNNLFFTLTDAQSLPFQDNSFDLVTIAFGLRNVTFQDKALDEIYRVLKVGGSLLILEFSQPYNFMQPLYDFYSFTILPQLGEWVAKDKHSYQYLAESIRKHPDQETLKTMMEAAGLLRCNYFNLTSGIVALHRGYKL